MTDVLALRTVAAISAAVHLAAALPPCAGPEPASDHASEHAHASTEAPPCHELPQLDPLCPCGCDASDAATSFSRRLGWAEPAAVADSASSPGWTPWLAQDVRFPASPVFGIDPVPV